MLGIFFFIHLEEFRESEEYIQENQVGCKAHARSRFFVPGVVSLPILTRRSANVLLTELKVSF